MKTIPKTVLLAALCTAAALCLSAPAFAAGGNGDGSGSSGGWEWMVAPYGWLASIGADANTGRPPSPVSSDHTFNDIIDKIEGAFQIHAEGQGDHFGVFADYTYLGLGDSKNFTHFDTNTDLDSTLFEAAGVWSLGDERFHGLDLFGGLRYIGVDFTFKLYPVNPAFGPAIVRNDKSYSDLMLGARYTWDLSNRWKLTVRGDGSFGQTDGTWNVSAVVQYEMKHGAWLFGYRYLDASFKSNGDQLDITLYGPQIGYGFKF